MPHRVTLITSLFGTVIEGVLLTLGMIVTGAHYVANSIISKETMNDLRGADGALVGAVLIVAVLWLSKMADNRKLDARHEEMMKLQKDNADKLMALTAEAIKAHGMSIQCSQSVDRTLQNLTLSINDRPCQAATFKKP